jgi:tetratricopeptide (TPR) repeat protein
MKRRLAPSIVMSLALGAVCLAELPEKSGSSELRRLFGEYLENASSVDGADPKAVDRFNEEWLGKLYSAFASSEKTDPLRARVLREIAAIHYSFGKLNKALEAYEEAADQTDSADQRLRARSMAANIAITLAKRSPTEPVVLKTASLAIQRALSEAVGSKSGEDAMTALDLAGALSELNVEPAFNQIGPLLVKIEPLLKLTRSAPPKNVAALLLKLAKAAASRGDITSVETIYEWLAGIEQREQSKGYFLWQCADYVDPNLRSAFRSFVEPRIGAVANDAWRSLLDSYLADSYFGEGRYDMALTLYFRVAKLGPQAFAGVSPEISRPEAVLDNARRQASTCLREMGAPLEADKLMEQLVRREKQHAPPAAPK